MEYGVGMQGEKMEIGVYSNIFPVEIINPTIIIMVTQRKNYPSLKELREKLPMVKLYAVDDKIYGYGSEQKILSDYKFIPKELNLYEVPKLACRMIKDVFADYLKGLGYQIDIQKYRERAIDVQHPLSVSIPQIKIYKAFEYRAIYFKNPLNGKLVFGIIPDLKYNYTWDGIPSSPQDIKNYCFKYSREKADTIIKEIMVRVGILIPGIKNNYFRNPEVLKQRFNEISEFMKQIDDNLRLFDTETKIRIHKQPIRIITGEWGEEYEWI